MAQQLANGSKADADPVNKAIGQAAVAGLAFLSIAVVAYILVFWREGCCSQARWGEFGDFLGGTVNPVLGFLSLLVLARTLIEQRRLLDETRRRAELEEMQRAIASACEALDKHLEGPFRTGLTSPHGESVYSVDDFFQMLGMDVNVLSDKQSFSADTPQHVRSEPVFSRTAQRWIRVVQVLRMYRDAGGSERVLQMYSSGYGPTAVMCHAVWPGVCRADDLAWLGLGAVEAQARALQKKFAAADAAAKIAKGG